MFPADPIFELEFARQRQRELDRRLELQRLVHAAVEERARFADRALTTIGDTLIDLGLRLRERYAEEATRKAG